MKNLTAPEIQKHRDPEADRLFETKDDEREYGGAFMIPVVTVVQGMRRRAYLRVLASNSEGWEHVSVSHGDRCPTWEEMDFIKRLFFKPHEVCFQLHPAEAENISNHPYCLHIWRPQDGKVPLPPSIMVGIPGLELQP